MPENMELLLKNPMETERLIIRPWKKNKSDAKALYSYAKDPKIGPAAGWPVHRDVSDSMQVIREILSTPGIYAVVLKETGLPIGAVGITFGATGRKFLKEREGEIGYWVGAPHWGKGYATEAVSCILELAFHRLHMEKVWCGYYQQNERSRRVQERCGFTWHHKEDAVRVEALGEIRTEHFTCLSRSEWEEQAGRVSV